MPRILLGHGLILRVKLHDTSGYIYKPAFLSLYTQPYYTLSVHVSGFLLGKTKHYPDFTKTANYL